MAKMAREQAVRERRTRKQQKKDEKKQAAAESANLAGPSPAPADDDR